MTEQQPKLAIGEIIISAARSVHEFETSPVTREEVLGISEVFLEHFHATKVKVFAEANRGEANISPSTRRVHRLTIVWEHDKTAYRPIYDPPLPSGMELS